MRFRENARDYFVAMKKMGPETELGIMQNRFIPRSLAGWADHPDGQIQRPEQLAQTQNEPMNSTNRHPAFPMGQR
jgi:hypothetical protein